MNPQNINKLNILSDRLVYCAICILTWGGAWIVRVIITQAIISARQDMQK